MASRGLSQPLAFSRSISANYALSTPSFLWCLTDLQTASASNPSHRELWFYWRREPVICSLLSSTPNMTFMILPLLGPILKRSCTPKLLLPEIWDQIMSFIPRYFLRMWLFVSPTSSLTLSLSPCSVSHQFCSSRYEHRDRYRTSSPFLEPSYSFCVSPRL